VVEVAKAVGWIGCPAAQGVRRFWKPPEQRKEMSLFANRLQAGRAIP
jgi:hypothetical protein